MIILSKSIPDTQNNKRFSVVSYIYRGYNIHQIGVIVTSGFINFILSWLST